MSTKSTKKWVFKRFGLRLNEKETKKLEAYCKREGRQINDVLREFVRSLPD